jgi:hypothetical protein
VQLSQHFLQGILHKDNLGKTFFDKVEWEWRQSQQSIVTSWHQVRLPETADQLEKHGFRYRVLDISKNLPQSGIYLTVDPHDVVIYLKKDYSPQYQEQIFIRCGYDILNLLVEKAGDLGKTPVFTWLKKLSQTVMDNIGFSQSEILGIEFSGENLFPYQWQGKRIADLYKLSKLKLSVGSPKYRYQKLFAELNRCHNQRNFELRVTRLFRLGRFTFPPLWLPILIRKLFQTLS